ncbi:MAG: hypothetical protein ACJ79A_02135 [Gemmatimonadaceae bacterium]
MSRATSVMTMLSAGVLCACSSFRPHSRTGSGSRGGLFVPRRPDDAPGEDGIDGRVLPAGSPSPGAGRAVGGTRRVCRAGSRPSGWIAVAYVSASDGECDGLTKADSGATAAVLTYYADRPIAATLEVCADEPVPRGWTIDAATSDPSDSCPGVERHGSSTYSIRRLR